MKSTLNLYFKILPHRLCKSPFHLFFTLEETWGFLQLEKGHVLYLLASHRVKGRFCLEPEGKKRLYVAGRKKAEDCCLEVKSKAIDSLSEIKACCRKRVFKSLVKELKLWNCLCLRKTLGYIKHSYPSPDWVELSLSSSNWLKIYPQGAWVAQ